MAASQDAYRRPTARVVIGSVPSQLASAIRGVCQDNCAGTRWSDRLFSEGLHPDVTGLEVVGDKGDTIHVQSSALSDAARRLILRQFLADDSFAWSNDTLQRRAEYSLSYREAQAVARTVSGMATETFGPLTATYLFLVSGSKVPEVKTEKEKTTVSAEVNVAVYRLTFSSSGDVANALGKFYCDSSCADRSARASAYAGYQPPISHVVSYSISPTAASDAGVDSAFSALGVAFLDEVIDETASRVPAFAISTRLLSDRPPSARIGRKEGVRAGARFFVYQLVEGKEGAPAIERRGAMLLARRVADNRVQTLNRTATTVQAARVDSTTFKRVYPGRYGSGDIVREKPSKISVFVGGAFMGFTPGNPERGVAVEVRDEALLPAQTSLLGLRASVAFKWMPGTPTAAGAVPSYLYGGLGFGYEFFPLAGKIRVTPMVLGFASKFDDGSTETSPLEEKVDYSAEFGVDFGFRVTPGVEVTMGLRQMGRVVLDEINPEKSTVISAPTMIMGMRFQRGRFGF